MDIESIDEDFARRILDAIAKRAGAEEFVIENLPDDYVKALHIVNVIHLRFANGMESIIIDCSSSNKSFPISTCCSATFHLDLLKKFETKARLGHEIVCKNNVLWPKYANLESMLVSLELDGFDVASEKL